MMKKHHKAVSVALAGLIATGMGSIASNAAESEKCYGVVKAGSNDCQTATSSCAGTATEDSQKDAWVLVPKGLCKRLVGGSKSAA